MDDPRNPKTPRARWYAPVMVAAFLALAAAPATGRVMVEDETCEASYHYKDFSLTIRCVGKHCREITFFGFTYGCEAWDEESLRFIDQG